MKFNDNCTQRGKYYDGFSFDSGVCKMPNVLVCNLDRAVIIIIWSDTINCLSICCYQNQATVSRHVWFLGKQVHRAPYNLCSIFTRIPACDARKLLLVFFWFVNASLPLPICTHCSGRFVKPSHKYFCY